MPLKFHRLLKLSWASCSSSRPCVGSTPMEGLLPTIRRTRFRNVEAFELWFLPCCLYTTKISPCRSRASRIIVVRLGRRLEFPFWEDVSEFCVESKLISGPTSAAYGFAMVTVLHSGHVTSRVNHFSMQSEWSQWPQGSFFSLSSELNSSKHMQQLSSTQLFPISP